MPEPIHSSSQPAPIPPETPKSQNPLATLFAIYIRPLQQQLSQIYQKHIKPLKDRIFHLETVNSELRARLEQEKRELQTFQFQASQKISALNKEVKTLRGQLEQMGAQHAEETTRLNTKVRELEQTCFGLQSALDRANRLLEQTNTALQNARSDATGLTEQIRGLLAELQAEKDGRRADVLGRNAERVEELERGIEQDKSTNRKAMAGMGASLVPLSIGLVVGGPPAWIMGIVSGVAMYYGSWSFYQDVKPKENELNRLRA